jgi:hypothetical protein
LILSPEGRSNQKVLGTDLLGATLVAGTFVSGVIAMSFGASYIPGTAARSSPAISSQASSSFFLNCYKSFCILTNKVDRIFAVESCQERFRAFLFIGTVVASTGLLLPLYQIPLTFQFTCGDTALMSAVRLLPFDFLFVFACMLSGAPSSPNLATICPSTS